MADYMLYEVVGFDYAQAIRELSHRMTLDRICEHVGYENRSTLYKIMAGATPDHKHGEAIYALYRNTFDRKPPLTAPQKAQLPPNVPVGEHGR